jgi:hypothetical protein
LGVPVVNPHEVGVFSELGDDFTRADPLILMCYRGDRHKALLESGVHPVGDLIQGLVEVPDGEVSRRRLWCSFLFRLQSHWAFLSSVVSSTCSLADNSSSEMSSWCRPGRVSEGPVSPAAMKTWRSGVPRPESVVATLVDVCSSVGANGVPSCKGSESR